MTKEDRNLLLIDLCARLPYNVKVCYDNKVCTVDAFAGNSFIIGETPDTAAIITYPENIKPYLLPLSSMTEEQKREYCSLVWFDGLSAGWNRDDAVILNEVEMLIDFYHKNHLDWRGLISKDLAIDATNLNIY